MPLFLTLLRFLNQAGILKVYLLTFPVLSFFNQPSDLKGDWSSHQSGPINFEATDQTRSHVSVIQAIGMSLNSRKD